MKRYFLLTAGLLLILMSIAPAEELKVCLDGSERNAGPLAGEPPPPAPGNDEAAYTGTVRVYLVEPLARWKDNTNQYYRYGFLDFPIVSDINMSDGDAIYLTSIWDASTTSIGYLVDWNIMAIGVVFSSQTVLTDARPPQGYWFQARYADAAAAATPGEVGRSEASPPYTHPVFIEESTATW